MVFWSGEGDSIDAGKRKISGVESRVVEFNAESKPGVTSCFHSESRANLSSNETSKNEEEEHEEI